MNAEQIRDEYLAKAREEARVSGRDVEVTSLAFAQACARIAELEGARAKAIGKPSAGFVRDEEWLREANSEVVGQAVGDTVEAIGHAMAELDRRADVIVKQADELKRLRKFSETIRENQRRCPSSWCLEAIGILGRTTDQAEPRKRRGPGPDGPPKAGDPQDADKDGAR
jgi:L-fucose isomerase-like protein